MKLYYIAILIKINFTFIYLEGMGGAIPLHVWRSEDNLQVLSFPYTGSGEQTQSMADVGYLYPLRHLPMLTR